MTKRKQHKPAFKARVALEATTPAARLLSRQSNWGLCLRRVTRGVVAGGAGEAVRAMACASTRLEAWPEP